MRPSRPERTTRPSTRKARTAQDQSASDNRNGILDARANDRYYTRAVRSPDDRFSYRSGRVDDNSDYHRFSTYRLGGNAKILPGVRLRASLSTAFNAPAFNQLRPTLFTVGSPNLQPERSRSAEVGLTGAWSELVRVSATYFNQRFSDLIQFVNGGPPDFKGSYANLTGASSNGYEAELALLLFNNPAGDRELHR